MRRQSIWVVALLAAATLCGCGGKNELVGGGQGNSVFLKSISMTPVNPTVSLTVAPQPPATAQFVVIGQYNVGNPKEITDQMTWTSLDHNVATIDAKGTATAAGSGRVIITAEIFEPATQKMFQAKTILTVVPQLTGISISPASVKIAKQTVEQLTALGTYNDGTQVDITSLAGWTSSQPAVATVSASPGTQGRVTAIAPGSASITASLGSVSSSAALTVTNANLVSMAVTPANPIIPLRADQQFTATGSFDDGSTQDLSITVRWEASDISIARITTAGGATGLGLGQANIRATMGAITESVAATIDASSVQKVVIVPISKVASGTRAQMRAAAILKDGGMIDVSQVSGVLWSSSNAGTAEVVPDSGLLTAKAAGATTISAKLGSQTGNTTLNVADATIQALAIAPHQAQIAPGTAQNLLALATFSDGVSQFQQDISNSAAWSSNNASVATVAFAHGLQEVAVGVQVGIADISASFSDSHGNSASSTVALNVSGATLSGISVTPGSTRVTTGGGLQFAASGSFSDGTIQDLALIANWSAADGSIAEVSPLGLAWARGPGQTSVNVTLAGEAGSSTVLVNPGALVRIDICPATTQDLLSNCPPLDPIPPPPPVSFPKNVPFGMAAVGTFSDGSREDLTSSVRWTSSSAALAAISNEAGFAGLVTGIAGRGFVTGLTAGHVTLSALANGAVGSLDVIVTDATPQFLTVTPTNRSTQLGVAQQMQAIATFSDGTNLDVTRAATWITSDPSVVIVSAGGLAYSSGLGTSTITARFGDAAGFTTLTVQ